MIKAAPAPVIKTITRLERKRNSVNGGPRYRIHFDDGTSALTQPDAMVSYGLENAEYRKGPVKIDTTPSGLVYGVTPCE